MNCAKCRRPASFVSRGKKSSGKRHGDQMHDLCAACWRDQGNAARANRLRPTGRPAWLLPPFPPLEAMIRMVELGGAQ